MNGLRDFWKPRRRVDKIVLVVTSVIALLVIAAGASGCGSAKKSDTKIAYVKVLPRKQTLQQGVTTIITQRPNLTFVVGVRNAGNDLEQNVKVTLVIHQKPPNNSITRTLSIAKISNGATQEVDFRGPFNLTTLISVVPIDVRISPGPNETSLVDNTATYEVRFSLG